MAGLTRGDFSADESADRAFFEQHLSPWVGRLFADIERVKSAHFYSAVGTLGRIFIEIEAQAFELPP
jgi:TorA maturation chaperone TorD